MDKRKFWAVVLVSIGFVGLGGGIYETAMAKSRALATLRNENPENQSAPHKENKRTSLKPVIGDPSAASADAPRDDSDWLNRAEDTLWRVFNWLDANIPVMKISGLPADVNEGRWNGFVYYGFFGTITIWGFCLPWFGWFKKASDSVADKGGDAASGMFTRKNRE
jgi:hypothetical protein